MTKRRYLATTHHWASTRKRNSDVVGPAAAAHYRCCRMTQLPRRQWRERCRKWARWVSMPPCVMRTTAFSPELLLFSLWSTHGWWFGRVIQRAVQIIRKRRIQRRSGIGIGLMIMRCGAESARSSCRLHELQWFSTERPRGFAWGIRQLSHLIYY